MRTGTSGIRLSKNHWETVVKAGAADGHGPPRHRELVGVAVTTRGADADVELDLERSWHVARSRKPVAVERPLPQRKYDRPRPAEVRMIIGRIPDVRVVLAKEEEIDERPVVRSSRHRASVPARKELPVVRDVEVVAQVESVVGFQRLQSLVDPPLVGRVEHQIDVVVPRYAAVVSVRAEKCSADHEVGDVPPVQLTQQSAQGEVQRTKIVLGHRRREDEIQIVDGISVNGHDGADSCYTKDRK